jgi:acyl carrier protein
MPPSVLGTIADEDLPALRTVIAAGESCPPNLVDQWVANGQRRFFNAYGPTETTVWASVAECSDSTRLPPIGRPVLNTRIYLLDKHLHLVPVGVTGELHVAGVGLARGYLNRPDATAEKFIPDPFGVDSGARLYRTGDLGRYLPEGQIEYLGRGDDQVKVRGFRIEPGEVEAALNAQEGVRESVVIAREDVPGDKRLVAYLVPTPAKKIIVSELREVLKERLPAYMVPAAFVILAELPLTPNGKVDRRNLPAPDGRSAEPEADYVAPQNEIEMTIAGVWRETLRLEKVGAHDNFFDIGGNSLLVVQVRGKLKELLGRETPIIEMFNHPTVSSLAGYLAQGENSLDSSTHEGAERATTRRELMRRQALARRGK